MIKQILSNQMVNDRYTIIVRRYLFNQLRIQITDVTQSGPHAPDGHGSIVQELDTYDKQKMEKIVDILKNHPDPLEYAESLRQPWNSTHPNDRIRLDNTRDGFN